MPAPPTVTELLNAYAGGDRSVLDELVPAVYEDLRAMAHRHLHRERDGHTLNTTALVHEAYLKLADVDRLTWRDRAHFYAVCGQAMRRILVNWARDRSRLKRGGDTPHVPLTDVVVAARDRPDDLLAADEALTRLAGLNPRQARVVECRVFGGMSVEDTAATLAISPATVKRDWTAARAWLNREMAAGAGP